jgi:hypothetical protein
MRVADVEHPGPAPLFLQVDADQDSNHDGGEVERKDHTATQIRGVRGDRECHCERHADRRADHDRAQH